MRLDKFLKVSRIIKRRTIANEISSEGHIAINGKKAKPSSSLKEDATKMFKVLSEKVRVE